eukprot:257781-Prorocentrum_minimum.AAC.5
MQQSSFHEMYAAADADADAAAAAEVAAPNYQKHKNHLHPDPRKPDSPLGLPKTLLYARICKTREP